jgi:ketosteroid isomerase-like protein
VFHGHAGVRAWLAKLQEAWGKNFRFEPRAFTEGDELVVADVRASATGTGSAVPIEMTVYMVLRLRDDGKVIWTQSFLERDDAVQAAGLRE